MLEQRIQAALERRLVRVRRIIRRTKHRLKQQTLNRYKQIYVQRLPWLFKLIAFRAQQGSLRSPRYAYLFSAGQAAPRLLILVDNIRATYFLSFHFALQQLHRKEQWGFFVLDSREIRRWCQSASPKDFVDQVIADSDPTAVIFSRYGLPHGEVLPELFKARQVATICHFDDDLLHVDPALGSEIQTRQGDPAVLHARRTLLESCDLIYASTPILAQRFQGLFPQQPIFQGIYAPYLKEQLLRPKFSQSLQPKTTLTIGYMGSKGHQADLEMVTAAIAEVLRHYPHVRFETFGTIEMPLLLQDFSGRIQAHRVNTDYAGFLRQLQQLRWDIGLAPLQNTSFNHCKAPTKYIEYTACGIPTIASQGPVYDQFSPELQILFAKSEEWATKIIQLIEHPDQRAAMVNYGQAYCAQTFSLAVLESQLKTLLTKV